MASRKRGRKWVLHPKNVSNLFEENKKSWIAVIEALIKNCPTLAPFQNFCPARDFSRLLSWQCMMFGLLTFRIKLIKELKCMELIIEWKNVKNNLERRNAKVADPTTEILQQEIGLWVGITTTPYTNGGEEYYCI